MKDLKDLKVGDKAFILVTVQELNNNITYPLRVVTNGGLPMTFTIDGKYNINEQTPSLFLTNPFEQQGKWMMVSYNNKQWLKRFVIAEKNGFYAFWNNADTEEKLLESTDCSACRYAKELEPTQVELTLEQIAEKFGCDVNQLKIKK